MNSSVSTHRRLVDLSHVITDGMVTYPGLPTPEVATHLSREAAEEIYGPGTTFHIGLVTMCTNTGTYLDVPFHRFADGHDLTELPLERVADVPAVCIDRRGEQAIDLVDELAELGAGAAGITGAAEAAGTAEAAGVAEIAGLKGCAVLVRTDHSVHFGTDNYLRDHPYLTAASADALVAAGVACVGIDSLNIDSTQDGQRPVHTALLRAGIPIIEHLTNLAEIPERGFRFTAVPPKIEGAGTFTVRAFADIVHR